MATRLAQAHRLAQAQLAEALARVVLAQWRVNVRTASADSDAFVSRALPLVQRQATTSAALTRRFYGQVRSLELPGADAVALDVESLPDEKVVAGLVAAGFQQLSDSLEAGHDLSEALRIAGSGAAGSAVRNALEPGRRLIRDSAQQDSRVVGFYRVTAADARVCFFCSMLASRGAVYSRQSFDASDPRFYGPGEVKVHDRCRCGYAPFFRDEPDLPDSIEQLYGDWTTATGHATGKEKARAWRRYWEALSRGEDLDLALARARRDADAVARLRVESGSIGGETREAAA